MLDTQRVAAEYPGAQDKAFLDAACVSLAPRSAVQAISAFLDMALTCPGESSTQHHINMDMLRQEALPEAARLLAVPQDNIALVESTTHGLNIIARGLPLPPGSEVLVSEMEFLQLAIPWVMQEGVTVIPVPHSGGRVLPSAFAERITPRTRMIVLSSTQWSNGFRCDLAAFAELCRRHDLLLAVDSIQQLGAIRVEPEREGIDLVVNGGHKWLNSPYGCGLFYAGPRVLDRLQPCSWGYLNLDDPEGGWGTYFSTPGIVAVRRRQDYHFVRTARRLEIGGTSNYPGAIGLAASMRLLNDLGTRAVEEHVLGLTDLLIDLLPATGATLVTVPERRYRSGIVSFRFYRDVASERALVARLSRERVMVSIRFTAGIGGIRVSCHYFNTRAHLQALLEALRRAGKERAPDYGH